MPNYGRTENGRSIMKIDQLSHSEKILLVERRQNRALPQAGEIWGACDRVASRGYSRPDCIGIRGRAMTTKTKGRNGGDRPTQKTSDTRNPTGIDPLAGWFSITKSSRITSQQKRRWQRGARR